MTMPQTKITLQERDREGSMPLHLQVLKVLNIAKHRNLRK